MPNNNHAEDQPLKIACSGTGYFSQFHYDAWSRIHGATLVGVHNRTIEKAEQFATSYSIPAFFGDFRTMLEQCNPDIIDIITPPETHLHAVTIAAELGIDAICQKPFGENEAQAKAMVKIAREAGTKLIVHENFRFMPWYRKIREVIDNGMLGHILNAEFKLRPGDGQGPNAYLARQPYFQDMPRFLIHETAIHLVDTFRYLFGEPEGVYAQLRRCNPVIKGEDSGVVLFDFNDSLQVIFNGNRLLDHNATNTRRTMGELEISGTTAELRLDGEARLWLREFGQQSSTQLDFQWQDKNFGGDCVFETIRHIVNHYLTGGLLENQGADYLQNIHIENIIYDSAEKGKRIEI